MSLALPYNLINIHAFSNMGDSVLEKKDNVVTKFFTLRTLQIIDDKYFMIIV